MARLAVDHPARARFMNLAWPLWAIKSPGTVASAVPRPRCETLVIARPTAISLGYAAMHWAQDTLLLVDDDPLGAALSALVDLGDITPLGAFWTPAADKVQTYASWSDATRRSLTAAYHPVTGGAGAWSVIPCALADISPTTTATWLVDLGDDDPDEWLASHLDWLAQVIDGEIHVLSRAGWADARPVRRVAGEAPPYYLKTFTIGDIP